MKVTDKDVLFCMDCKTYYTRSEGVPVFNERGVKLRTRCKRCDEKIAMLRAMTPAERDAYLGSGD